METGTVVELISAIDNERYILRLYTAGSEQDESNNWSKMYARPYPKSVKVYKERNVKGWKCNDKI